MLIYSHRKNLNQIFFAALSGRQTATSSIALSMNSFDDDVRRQIKTYENPRYTSCEDTNPLLF